MDINDIDLMLVGLGIGLIDRKRIYDAINEVSNDERKAGESEGWQAGWDKGYDDAMSGPK